MRMENEDDNQKGAPESRSSLHPDSDPSKEIQYDGGLVPDNVEDTNELVDESAQVTSKQLTFV